MIRPTPSEISDQVTKEVRSFSDTCSKLRDLVSAVEQAHEERQRRQREEADELKCLLSELEAGYKKRLAAHKKRLDQHVRAAEREMETLRATVRAKLDALTEEARGEIVKTVDDERARLEPRESADEQAYEAITRALEQAQETLTASLEGHLAPLRGQLSQLETNGKAMAQKVRGILEDFRDRTKAELESVRGRITRDNAWVGHLAEEMLQLKSAVAQLTAQVEALRGDRGATPPNPRPKPKPRA